MSDYYYGQGKLYLARRNAAGQALSWRWVGDVSSLNVELEFEEHKSKSSVGGKVIDANRYISGVSGKITSSWHELSADNLSALLLAENIHQKPNLMAKETLPFGIVSGDRVSLQNQNVWGLNISGMTMGIDYCVDNTWGVVNFITTPINQPITVEYQHSGSRIIPISERLNDEFSLRYEGMNLAEDGNRIIIEIYRVSLDPLATLSLLDNDSKLNVLETTASILYDTNKSSETLFGGLGRIIVFNKMSGITHNGFIGHNGIHTHRG